MHPNRDDIKGYVLGGITGKQTSQVAEHLAVCELCRELAEEYRGQVDAVRQAEEEGMPVRAENLKRRLVQQAFGPKVIRLEQLKTETVLSSRLAADGRAARPRWEHLRTFYSESPEVVLRLMRDTEKSQDYMQVIADDSSLYAHIVVDVPEKDVRLVTDENGFAGIEPGLLEKAGDADWQIHLPEAVFALEALDYDPDRTESKRETVLTTDNDDRVKIVFERKTEGRQLSIEILQLDGRTDFGPVQAVLTVDDAVDSWKASPRLGRTIKLTDEAKKIILRLFH